MKTRVYKIEILVVDHDCLGPDGATEVLENTRYPNYCMNPKVVSVTENEVDWDDDHPLNRRDTWRAAYDALFPKEKS